MGTPMLLAERKGTRFVCFSVAFGYLSDGDALSARDEVFDACVAFGRRCRKFHLTRDDGSVHYFIGVR